MATKHFQLSLYFIAALSASSIVAFTSESFGAGRVSWNALANNVVRNSQDASVVAVSFRPPSLHQASSNTDSKVELDAGADANKTALMRLKLKMNEVSRSMDDAENRAERAEREIESLRSKIKNVEGDDNDGDVNVANILEDGSISAVLQQANEAIAEARSAVVASGESAEEAFDQAAITANEKAKEEQKWRAKRELEAKLDQLEQEKRALEQDFRGQSEEKAARISDLETRMEMARDAAAEAEERTRIMLEERAETEAQKDAMLQEREAQKDEELSALRDRLEEATMKQEQTRARVLALKISKQDVQQAMVDHISSLQEELRNYEQLFSKLQQETDEKYERRLQEYRTEAKADTEERLSRQEELARQERNDMIEGHRESIDRIYGKLEKAKAMVERFQEALEQARKDSKEKIAALVKENTERMEELVEKYESERELMVQEFSETLGSQDDAIEELQDLNSALNLSLVATKESHSKEVNMLNKQYLQQRLSDKADAERKRATLLERHAKVVSEKNVKISFYEDERGSVRKMIKQSFGVIKGRAKSRLQRFRSEPEQSSNNDDSGSSGNGSQVINAETEPLS